SRFAEFDGAFVNLIVGHQFFRKLGAAAEHDDEQAGGIGVERAAMSDFFDAELAANRVHDIVRRGPGGFINEKRAVERGEFLHGNYFAASSACFMAAITLRCTASG